MRFQTIAVLFVLTAEISPVLGGNRMWETSINYAAQVVAVTDPAVFTGENITATPTRRSIPKLNKRYFGAQPGTGSADLKLWPDKVVKYCFDTIMTQAQIDATWANLKDAKNLWHDVGLSSSFVYEPADTASCAAPLGDDRRKKFLNIKFKPSTDPTARLATTVGLPPVSADHNGEPTMELTDRLDVGMLNVVSNYAHEMGHAWGLDHEHQNEFFWKGDIYSESGTAGPFGEGNFNCQNLADYPTVLAELTRTVPNEAQASMAVACRNRLAAVQIRFSASEYLPIKAEPHTSDSKDGVDWDSIMLYPSGAGGDNTGNPTPVAGSDLRQPILLKPDGSRIEPNTKPSNRDAKGLTKMYGGLVPPKITLFGDKASTNLNKILNIRKKEPGAGCF